MWLQTSSGLTEDKLAVFTAEFRVGHDASQQLSILCGFLALFLFLVRLWPNRTAHSQLFCKSEQIKDVPLHATIGFRSVSRPLPEGRGGARLVVRARDSGRGGARRLMCRLAGLGGRRSWEGGPVP